MKLFLSFLAVSLLGCIIFAESKDSGVCGPPPPPKPAQASSAEGMPPLPLPATPQRRTEKKNPPSPPVIVSKIKTNSLDDWSTDPNDINNLLIWMKSALGVNFSSESQELKNINLSQVPVVYRTGHNAFSFTPEQRKLLRSYILSGGMVVFDSCCGRKEFASSARSEIKQILPEYPLKPIALDHALFNCYYENAGVFSVSGLTKGEGLFAYPKLEGVEISCRMAVVFSPYDMSCGWDIHSHSSNGMWIKSDQSLKIGANIMAYATATRDMGMSAADAKAYKDIDNTRVNKFRIGQIVHDGCWNPDSVGLRNLLDTVAQKTSIQITYSTDPIDNMKDLNKYPFIYMTGHDDFIWNENQTSAMRNYFERGGFLLADSCCGRKNFDQAFRREIAKVIKTNKNLDGSLVVFSSNHPIYSIQEKIDKVQLTEAAMFKYKGQENSIPALEYGIVSDKIVVIYSPLSLNVGWRLKNIPYACGYSSKSALDLGVNIIMYNLSQ
jgi:hypothetical protein